MFNLTVTHAFGPYAKGDTITDPADIDAALSSHPDHVVRVAVVDVPEPAPVRPGKAN